MYIQTYIRKLGSTFAVAHLPARPPPHATWEGLSIHHGSGEKEVKRTVTEDRRQL
jgi:hypothetical protein